MASGGSVNTDFLSDETFDLLCRVCKRKGKNIEAKKYCLECQDYFCVNCVKVHEDIPALTSHKILDKSQFSSRTSKKLPQGPQGSNQGQLVAPTEKCNRHSHYIIDTYCQNHDEVGCATCIAVDHRLCKDIFYIPEFIQNNSSASTHGKIKKELDSTAKSLKEFHQKLQKEKDHHLKQKAGILERIRKFRREINERLDKLEKYSIADIEDKYKALIEKIEEGMRVLDANKANVKSAQDKVGAPGNNVSQEFVNAKKGKHIASNASQCIEHNKTHTHTKEIDFTPDQRISELLGEISLLGKITQLGSSSTSNLQLQTKGNQTTSGSCTAKQTDALLITEGSRKYNVRVQSDTFKCSIVSACTLEDGTIILSDCFNNKLKHLNSSTFKVRDFCDLPGVPGQVCPISKQEVAVCMPFEQEVQFISVGARLKKTKQINIDFTCHGLAYYNGNLYISDNDTSVYIYSVSGSNLRLLCENQPGQELFSDIRSLAVSNDGSKIYVSDRNKGLIILDSNGQVIGQYNGPQLQLAADCYLTAIGSLLVCGCDSDNVLQFGQNGDLRNEVVEFIDIDAWHQAICCNPQMSKMLIGREEDEVEVYDLVTQRI